MTKEMSYMLYAQVALFASAAAPRLHLCMSRTQGSSQCKSLASCCPPCDIHMMHDSSQTDTYLKS